MLEKKFFFLHFFVFCFFLLIISGRVDRKCFCRQDLRIRGMQITQNNISHPQSLMVNYVIIYINFLDSLCWFKHAFIWILLRIEFSGKVCLQRCGLQLMQNSTSSKSQIISYIIMWIIFEGFFCWSKHGFLWT